MHLEVKISLIKRSWQVPTALSWVFIFFFLILVCFNQALYLQKRLWVLINYLLPKIDELLQPAL